MGPTASIAASPVNKGISPVGSTAASPSTLAAIAGGRPFPSARPFPTPFSPGDDGGHASLPATTSHRHGPLRHGSPRITSFRLRLLSVCAKPRTQTPSYMPSPARRTGLYATSTVPRPIRALTKIYDGKPSCRPSKPSVRILARKNTRPS